MEWWCIMIKPVNFFPNSGSYRVLVGFEEWASKGVSTISYSRCRTRMSPSAAPNDEKAPPARILLMLDRRLGGDSAATRRNPAATRRRVDRNSNSLTAVAIGF